MAKEKLQTVDVRLLISQRFRRKAISTFSKARKSEDAAQITVEDDDEDTIIVEQPPLHDRPPLPNWRRTQARRDECIAQNKRKLSSPVVQTHARLDQSLNCQIGQIEMNEENLPTAISQVDLTSEQDLPGPVERNAAIVKVEEFDEADVYCSTFALDWFRMLGCHSRSAKSGEAGAQGKSQCLLGRDGETES